MMQAFILMSIDSTFYEVLRGGQMIRLAFRPSFLS
jgi:hypothetical protein